MSIINLLGEQWLIGALQLILGGLIKQHLKDKLIGIGMKATAYIPLANLFIAYLGFQILPTTAQAAGFIASVVPVKEGAVVLVSALLQTVMVTGTFSFGKNTFVPVAKTGAKWLFAKLSPWVAKF